MINQYKGSKRQRPAEVSGDSDDQAVESEPINDAMSEAEPLSVIETPRKVIRKPNKKRQIAESSVSVETDMMVCTLFDNWPL